MAIVKRPDKRTSKLIIVTMNCPRKGQAVNVDGDRGRVLRVLSFTGTVAQVEVEWR